MPGKASWRGKEKNDKVIPFMDDGEKISKMTRPSIAIAVSQFAKITVHEMMKGNKNEKCKIIHIEI